MKKVFAAIALVSVAALQSFAVDPNRFYAGLDAGTIKEKFEPQYAFANGRPDSSFKNWAYGVEYGARAGYRMQLRERLELAIQGRFAWSDADWDLDTDEPAHLEYDIPYNYTFSLVPSVRVGSRARIYGEIGIGEGYVREQKTAPTASNYDQSDWISQLTCAGGVEFRVLKHASLFAEYRYVNYDRFDYTSSRPGSSEVVERISDSPESYVITAGLRCPFE